MILKRKLRDFKALKNSKFGLDTISSCHPVTPIFKSPLYSKPKTKTSPGDGMD